MTSAEHATLLVRMYSKNLASLWRYYALTRISRREASLWRFTVTIRVSKVSRITVTVSFWIRVRYSFV